MKLLLDTNRYRFCSMNGMKIPVAPRMVQRYDDTRIFNPELNIGWQDIGTGHETHKQTRN